MTILRAKFITGILTILVCCQIQANYLENPNYSVMRSFLSAGNTYHSSVVPDISHLPHQKIVAVNSLDNTKNSENQVKGPLLAYSGDSNYTELKGQNRGDLPWEYVRSAGKLGIKAKDKLKKFANSLTHFAKDTTGSIDIDKAIEAVGKVGQHIWKGSKKIDWDIDTRVMKQLEDRFSGAIKIDKKKMLELLENPKAKRLFDTKSVTSPVLRWLWLIP